MNIVNRIRSVYFLRKVLKGEKQIENFYRWHKIVFQLFRKGWYFEFERNFN